MTAQNNLIHLNRRRNSEVEYLMQVLEDIQATRPVAPIRIDERGVAPGDPEAQLCLGLSIKTATLYGYLDRARIFFLIQEDRIIFGIEVSAGEDPFDGDAAAFDRWINTVLLPALPFADFTVSDEHYDEHVQMVRLCAERQISGSSRILETMDAVCEATRHLAFPEEYPGDARTVADVRPDAQRKREHDTEASNVIRMETGTSTRA